MSLSLLDRHGNAVQIEGNDRYVTEIIIPRDPNIIIPPMTEQNVTFLNQSFHIKLMDLKEIQPDEDQTISIHFEIHPFEKNLSYVFIYQFDRSIQSDHVDGLILFCPLSELSSSSNLKVFFFRFNR